MTAAISQRSEVAAVFLIKRKFKMGKIRFFTAMAAAKLAYFGLRLLGRNATYLPGEIAVHICPDFIGYLTKPETVICVTGTNGKTTTSNLLNSVLTS